MKRAVILTVVLFVLSLGGLATMTMVLCRAQDRVEFTCVAQRGDAAVAEGLYLTEKNLLDSRVIWTTEHDLGAQALETRSTFAGTKQAYVGYMWSSEYGIYVMAPDEDTVKKQIQSDEDDSLIFHPAETMEYYDLGVTQGNCRDYVEIKDRGNGMFSMDFPLLRIPVGQGDWMSMSVWRSYDEVEYNVYASYLENGFHSWSAPAEDGRVMTVGFGPTVQPKADWAPEGFGLWLMTRGEGKTAAERMRLVYPLNIETQKVAYLSSTDDGKFILLFVAEGEKLSLQVLDAKTFRLVQTLDMGKIGRWDTEATYFDGDDEQGQTRKSLEYETVLVRRGEGFCAVAVGKRLVALECREDGLEKLFDCDMMDLYLIDSKDGLGFAWEDENVDSEQIAAVCSPVSSTWVDDFERLPMALRDGKLAIAWNVDNSNQVDVMVEVYSAEGLVYARGIRCGLLHQSRGSRQYLQAMQEPMLAWN